MLLRPQFEVSSDTELLDPIQNVLFGAGIVGAKKEDTALTKSKRDEIVSVLNKNGASLENVAAAISSGLADDVQRLRAAELVLRAHGLFDYKQNEVADNRIMVVVNGDNTQVAAVLNPKREAYNNL